MTTPHHWSITIWATPWTTSHRPLWESKEDE